jgi:hypothetical protein
MSILTRTILAGVLLVFPFFEAAYPASLNKTEPIAQVYEIRGKVTVKSSADGSVMEVKKGCLLGPDDSLTLERDALIAMYLKNGVRKEIRAKDTQVLYKVTDLLPRAEAYGQSVPLFGATRGILPPPASSKMSGFFYPQETVILDSPPSIEFILYHGSGEAVAFGGATVKIVKNNEVVGSGKFSSLEYNFPYVYEPAKLEGQTEYKIELRLELEKSLGNVAISFPLYITGISDAGSVSKYAPFSDAVYRSVESTPVDHQGKQRTITAIKQLVRRGASPQPVIVIELYIS